jgi:hypothetical protein
MILHIRAFHLETALIDSHIFAVRVAELFALQVNHVANVFVARRP